MMKYPLMTILILLLTASVALAEDDRPVAKRAALWDDGDPEVSLGAYFDAQGVDSILEGDIPDTLIVSIIMMNGGMRDEGDIRALEYSIEYPTGLEFLRDELPIYASMAMGDINKGITQVVKNMDGHGLLINTLTFLKVGDVPFDSRIMVNPHPQTGHMRYVYGKGAPENVEQHLMEGKSALLNPKLSGVQWKPTRAR
ncbi:MAG: hypothetical protein GY835_26625 [bacterium]|nr:hypothetical protein [bacterium]